MVARLTPALLPDDQAAEWNREVFHADQLAPEALVAAGASLSLFAGRRLVLVRGVGAVSYTHLTLPTKA